MVKRDVNLYQGLHKLNDLIFSLNKPLIGKKGLHYNKLLKDWLLIVGADIARYAIPTKISTSRRKNIPENILYIATNNASAGTELVYHLGILKEQINFYFGYEYIHQIKVVQAVFQIQASKELQIDKKLSTQQQSKLDKLVENYEQEDEIKNILLKFAKDIVQKC